MSRPPVSVIVPFFGDAHDAQELLGALAGLALAAGDEVLVADNTPHGACEGLAAGRMFVFASRIKRQPYSARNEAAARSRGEWLLFTDADCRPAPDLLDTYFADPPGERTGALAGGIAPRPGAPTLARRYAEDRRLLSPELFLAHPYKPLGVTANLLVRRDAFEEVGGFAEGIRSGGDADLCWRLQDAGWAIEHRPEAVVEHDHRETVRELLRQAARTSAGARWLDRRHPGSLPQPRRMRALGRALAGAATWPLRGRPERGAFMLVEALVIVAEAAGSLSSNARREPAGAAETVFVACVAPEDWDGRPLEAERRPRRPGQIQAAPGVFFAEDDGSLRRLLDTVLVVTRRPAAPWGLRHQLMALAPASRRLARAAPRAVEPVDPAARERALALGRLSGST